MVKYGFDYSEEKNIVLKETRRVGFEDIIDAIESGRLLENRDHPNQKKYPGQKIFVVQVRRYAYVVPYVTDKRRKVLFLKTLFPSRQMTKKYMGGGEKK